VNWNGTPLATKFVSATQLGASVSAALLAKEGAALVNVFTPAPGGGASNAQSFTVLEVPPTNLSLQPSPAAINEGSSITLSGHFTDPGPQDTHTVTINWGDGSAVTTLHLAAGKVSFTAAAHTYLDNPAGQPNGSYMISVQVSDDDGLSVGTTAAVQVRNVAPTVAIAGPTDAVPGQPRTFTFSATDPSPIDQATGFTYTVTWGDGTATQTLAATPGNGAGVAVDHVYTAPRSYSVQVTATDKDGGIGPVASQVVTVQTVQMQGGTLAVGGTLGNDNITLMPADTTGDITVNVNGTKTFNGMSMFKPTDHILVYGQSGNDTIKLVSNMFQGMTYYISVPALLYGGATGSDTLDARGSSANNVLTGGGGGQNVLYGGLGRDLLIAGTGGGSTLNAGSGGDILIGGWTDYDLNIPVNTGMPYDKKLQALVKIMAEWGRNDLTGTLQQQYNTRVNDLMNGGGLNGSSLLNAQTMHSNNQNDALNGVSSSTPLDWFFADVYDTNTLKHKNPGEQLTTIS
jgi:hypothetical protein